MKSRYVNDREKAVVIFSIPPRKEGESGGGKERLEPKRTGHAEDNNGNWGMSSSSIIVLCCVTVSTIQVQ